MGSPWNSWEKEVRWTLDIGQGHGKTKHEGDQK